MDIKQLIGETTDYDKKVALETKKPKSWCKSISAFANCYGGKLVFGVANDDALVGLSDAEGDAEKISEIIKTHLNPIPEFKLSFEKDNDKTFVIVEVMKGQQIPYYYEGDGQLIAFMRIGNESVPATPSQLRELVLHGSGESYDTVHKFQGKEMECIIISTVDDEISDFTDDPYLINVAVSRAKKKLMLVVTGNKQSKERNITDLIDYIEYNNFEVVESKIYSIFDYLYKQYTEARKAYLQKHKKISAYDSENLMYSLIEDILSDSKYSSLDVVCHFPLNMLIKNPEFLSEEECRYAMNPATHLDFLIYNRISKKPVLAIEVDGYEYHKKHTVQASRDLLKNRIMELYEIPLLRFMTNGSGEKEKIIEMLEQRMGQ